MLCGFYEKEITPPLGCDMPGGYCHRYTNEVKDRLYVKAAVLGTDVDKPETCTALVIIDAVEISREQADAIILRAAEYTGIPKERISASATHTHLGIPCGDVISYEDKAYMDVFCRLAADCVTLAFHRMVPCRASFGMGVAEHCSFVRDYCMKDGNVATNAGKYREEILAPNGEPDTELPAVSFYDCEGKPLACLYSFACHQDCVGGPAYSGDFSSHVSHRLKERYGDSFVSIYLAGASGDINHLNVIEGIRLNYLETAKTLAEQLIALTDTPKMMSDALSSRKEDLILKRRVATEEELEKARWIAEAPKERREKYDMTGQNASLMLKYEEAFADTPLEVAIPIHVIRVGEARIFALPGELYNVFGKALREGCDHRMCLLSELSNMAAGYIPPADLFGKAAYPVQLCHGSFLEPEAGEKIVAKALKMAREM